MGRKSTLTPRRERFQYFVKFMKLGILGVVLIGAGYIPTITAFLPTLGDTSSRFNQFAMIGGSLVLVSSLASVATLFASSVEQAAQMLWGSLTIFIAIGIMTQLFVIQAQNMAWHEQKNIWNSLFVAAPDIEDGTTVILLMSGYDDRRGFQSWQRLPFAAYWDFTGGLRNLYENDSLAGEIVFTDIENEHPISFESEGFFNSIAGQWVGYANTLVYRFDEDEGVLSHLEALPTDVTDLESMVALCESCILDEAVDPESRALVRP